MAEAQDEQQTEKPQEPTASNRPVAKFSGSGGISVAIWKQKSENGSEFYSTRLDRTYRNNEGQPVSTPYLREGDLLRARKVLSQADDWIEQEKAKYRASNRDAGAGRA